MTRSTDQVVRDLEAQLAAQRTATVYYQKALNAAFTNLRMMGRDDVVKSIQRESLDDMREALVVPAVLRDPTPQPQIAEIDDDDCLY